MTMPCGNCPFRREGFIPLRADRVVEIAEGMLCTQGTSFACHKTTGHDDDGETTIEPESQHCGGALIFAEKNGNATQMMRICERLGMYDAAKLVPHYDLVFDDVDQMVEAHEAHPIMRGERQATVRPARIVASRKKTAVKTAKKRTKKR